MRNYIEGEWRDSAATESIGVVNPATGEELARVPLSPVADIDKAAHCAAVAFPDWRATPAGDRVQPLFRLKTLLEQHLDALARTITMECGKTLVESKGELRRAIENVETACGIPALTQGLISEDIAPGIDEMMVRQPVGVCACIAPFNFPAMIPFWFLPYALACGNTYVVKPSEKVPLTMEAIFRLIEQCAFPKGVVNLVQGGRAAAEAVLDHPLIRAISFVGTTEVARHVYARAAAEGKRVQCQGGAKNPVVVLADADLEMTSRIVADSAFGCAGQRCLAASIAVTVGDSRQRFTQAIAETASTRRVGNGLDESVEMGPVINAASRDRIQQMIGDGVREGARVLVDGRDAAIPGLERGYFVKPTVIEDVDPASHLAATEVFGPVLSLIHVATVDEAIALVNRGRYGNMACLFTSSGAAARKFRNQADVGNVGINVGVAAPIAWFPFSGARESFFGDLHGQGRDAVEFFTQKKVIVERWPREWSRQF